MHRSTDAMKIAPPFGYGEITQLQKTSRVLLPSAGSTPAFCRDINALALSIGEFVPAGRDYPIAFSSADGGATYTPIAILGLAERQNLFVDQTGEWNKGCYLPAFVRRYPFCISKLYVDGQARKERLVCIIKTYLDDQGIALFDESDRPTAQWQAIERLLQGYEDDLDATAEFCAILTRLELLSPFKFEVMNDQKATLTVQGMHRVDEAKLKDIKPASLKVLVTKGLMGHIYAHMHSLERFADLYLRAGERAAKHTTATVKT